MPMPVKSRAVLGPGTMIECLPCYASISCGLRLRSKLKVASISMLLSDE